MLEIYSLFLLMNMALEILLMKFAPILKTDAKNVITSALKRSLNMHQIMVLMLFRLRFL